MNFRQTFIVNLQTAIAIQPTVRPLHDPTMSPQLLGTLDALARYARRNPASSQCSSFLARVICFISVQFRGAFARTTARAFDWADRVNSSFHHPYVMHIGSRNHDRQRDALPFDRQMAFRSRFAAIRRILPGLVAPFCAGTDKESKDARDQSILFASPKRLSSAWRSSFHTPARATHEVSASIMPEPQPISGGRYSHGSPVESAKRMPRSRSRFGMRGLPPRGVSGSGGSKQ